MTPAIEGQLLEAAKNQNPGEVFYMIIHGGEKDARQDRVIRANKALELAKNESLAKEAKKSLIESTRRVMQEELDTVVTELREKADDRLNLLKAEIQITREKALEEQRKLSDNLESFVHEGRELANDVKNEDPKSMLLTGAGYAALGAAGGYAAYKISDKIIDGGKWVWDHTLGWVIKGLAGIFGLRGAVEKLENAVTGGLKTGATALGALMAPLLFRMGKRKIPGPGDVAGYAADAAKEKINSGIRMFTPSWLLGSSWVRSKLLLNTKANNSGSTLDGSEQAFDTTKTPEEKTGHLKELLGKGQYLNALLYAAAQEGGLKRNGTRFYLHVKDGEEVDLDPEAIKAIHGYMETNGWWKWPATGVGYLALKSILWGGSPSIRGTIKGVAKGAVLGPLIPAIDMPLKTLKYGKHLLQPRGWEEVKTALLHTSRYARLKRGFSDWRREWWGKDIRTETALRETILRYEKERQYYKDLKGKLGETVWDPEIPNANGRKGDYVARKGGNLGIQTRKMAKLEKRLVEGLDKLAAKKVPVQDPVVREVLDKRGVKNFGGDFDEIMTRHSTTPSPVPPPDAGNNPNPKTKDLIINEPAGEGGAKPDTAEVTNKKENLPIEPKKESAPKQPKPKQGASTKPKVSAAKEPASVRPKIMVEPETAPALRIFRGADETLKPELAARKKIPPPAEQKKIIPKSPAGVIDEGGPARKLQIKAEPVPPPPALRVVHGEAVPRSRDAKAMGPAEGPKKAPIAPEQAPKPDLKEAPKPAAQPGVPAVPGVETGTNIKDFATLKREVDAAKVAGDKALAGRLISEHRGIIQSAAEADVSEASAMMGAIARTERWARAAKIAKGSLPFLGTIFDAYLITINEGAISQARQEGKADKVADLERERKSLIGVGAGGLAWSGLEAVAAATPSGVGLNTTVLTIGSGSAAAPGLVTAGALAAPVVGASFYKQAIDASVAEWKQSEQEYAQKNGAELLGEINNKMTERTRGSAATNGDNFVQAAAWKIRKIFHPEEYEEHYRKMWEDTENNINRPMREKMYTAYFMRNTDVNRFPEAVADKKNFIQFFGGRNFGTVPAMVLRQADDYAELKAAYRRCKAENKPPVIKSPFDGKEIDLTPFSRDGEPPEEEKLKIRNILARYREGIKIPDSFRENSREIAEASGLSGASQEKPLQAIGTRIRAEILSGMRHHLLLAEERLQRYETETPLRGQVVRQELQYEFNNLLSEAVSKMEKQELTLDEYQAILKKMEGVCSDAGHPKRVFQRSTLPFKSFAEKAESGAYNRGSAGEKHRARAESETPPQCNIKFIDLAEPQAQK